jgi:2-polyprenyl-6-methoxyphenol hydroxylase-like FAD-dependent oxidoreductase
MDAMTNGAEKNAQAKKIHVLIVGAGLTGLLLAQGLRKLNAALEAQGLPARYTFTIYERDESASYRGGGFSLTIHWALQELYEILPEYLSARIFECVGNPDAIARGEMGSFKYLNLRTGIPAFQTSLPPGWKGARMSRVKFLSLLMTDLQIEFGKRLSEITFPSDDTVCAEFEGGQRETGELLIGADGSRSVVRRFVYGNENSRNRQLPVRMINCRAEYPFEDLQACLKIDPHLFHGGDPVQNGYFMFAFLDMPRPGSEKARAAVQLTLSWPFEEGYLGESEPSDPPKEHLDRIAWLRRLAKNWANPVHDLIENMPEDSMVRAINIEEWMPNDANRRRTDGRLTLVGDAAHLMTSCKSSSKLRGSVRVTDRYSSWRKRQSRRG